jgi:hypothetical protein
MFAKRCPLKACQCATNIVLPIVSATGLLIVSVLMVQTPV